MDSPARVSPASASHSGSNRARLTRARLTNRTLIVVAAVALLGWGLGAKDDALKIGVVDLDQAITSTNEGRAAREEFDRKKRQLEGRIMPLMEEYRTGIEEFEAKKFVLSDDARFQKQLDMAELQNKIENERKQIEGQLQVDRERLVAPLRNKLISIVEEVGRDEGFSLILHRNSPGIMYSKEALDVTELIIKKFNQKG
jgi:outer membrane protein